MVRTGSGTNCLWRLSLNFQGQHFRKHIHNAANVAGNPIPIPTPSAIASLEELELVTGTSTPRVVVYSVGSEFGPVVVPTDVESDVETTD